MTRMRVILHIGHYKCGTTALQRRLANHRAQLRSQGVVYPELGVFPQADLPNHSALVFEMLRARDVRTAQWYETRRDELSEPPTIDDLTERLRSEIDAAAEAGCAVVMSSEEFMRFGAGAPTEGMVDELAELLGPVDVTVFAHLRRPDGHLPSWYNQVVKLGATPENLSQNLARSVRTIQVDYAKALSPWVERFGADRVIVRRYEHRRGDITDDMLEAVGLDVTLPVGTERWENERFPDVFIETLRRWNALGAPADLTNRVRRTARDLASGELADVKVDVLTPTARMELVEAFRPIDAALSELLDLGDASLFEDIEEIATRDADAIRDVDAHRDYAPLLLERALAQETGPPGPPMTARDHRARALMATGRRAALRVRDAAERQRSRLRR